MRFDGPADSSLLRVATEDLEIAGTPVRRGEAVLVVAGSANHDGSRFPEPEIRWRPPLSLRGPLEVPVRW